MHVRVDDLELYVLGRLPEPQAATISSHVADCPTCSETLDETKDFIEKLAELRRRQTTPRPDERRQNRRLPTNDPATIKLIHPTVSEPLPARILDVSKDGLKVEVSELLESGTTIEILTERIIAIGEVRYCVRMGEAYHVGISIQDAFTKSESPPTSAT